MRKHHFSQIAKRCVTKMHTAQRIRFACVRLNVERIRREESILAITPEFAVSLVKNTSRKELPDTIRKLTASAAQWKKLNDPR
jgi:hypothetical protein